MVKLAAVPVPAESPEAVTLLREILGELRAIRQALPQRVADDGEKLHALLIAAHSAFGSAAWTTGALLAASLKPRALQVRAALTAIYGPRSEGGVRRVARFLAKNTGCSAGGLRLERLGMRNRYGELYRVTE